MTLIDLDGFANDGDGGLSTIFGIDVRLKSQSLHLEHGAENGAVEARGADGLRKRDRLGREEKVEGAEPRQASDGVQEGRLRSGELGDRFTRRRFGDAAKERFGLSQHRGKAGLVRRLSQKVRQWQEHVAQ